jgi:diguanylate cyclase (GGDEF)-like protein
MALHFFAASSTYYYEFIYMKERFIEEALAKNYENRKAQYENFLDEEMLGLNAFAQELSANETVLAAYVENDREKLINRFESFWKNMAEDALIKEIHFFKKPAISFVNFANVDKYNVDVTQVRGDISWVTSSFQPSTHFLVCRLYPGLRATYPVIKDDTMLGGVSLGVDMDRLAGSMQKLFNSEVLFVLEEEKLQTHLNPKSYDAIIDKGTLKSIYRFFGDGDELDEASLKERQVFRNNMAYSIFPIHDFHEKGIGYFVFKDDFSDRIAFSQNQAWQTFIYYSAVGIFVFIAILLLINRIVKTLDQMIRIMRYIREKSFDKLDIVGKDIDRKNCDEICRFESQLVETGMEIRNYLDLLTKEMHDYADKMHMDALTQVFNRYAIDDIGENLFLKAQLAKQPMAVMMLDIDNFKPVNDTFGHDFGDVVLKHISDDIKEKLRNDDFLARYGGEEFVIVLPKTSIEGAFEVAGKICRRVEEDTISMGDKRVQVTVSIGLTEVHDDDGTLYDAIKRADEKLYKAKENGKNRVEI